RTSLRGGAGRDSAVVPRLVSCDASQGRRTAISACPASAECEKQHAERRSLRLLPNYAVVEERGQPADQCRVEESGREFTMPNSPHTVRPPSAVPRPREFLATRGACLR